MKTILPVILLLTFAMPVRGQRLLLWASTAADLGSTLTRSNGYREGNPLLGQSKPRIAATMLAMTAWTDWSTHRLESQQKPNQVKWIRIAVVATHVFCVGWNLRVGG